MYICKDSVCDPVCDFCWYCIHDENGTPCRCVKNILEIDDGIGYCDKFRCRLHEAKPDDIVLNNNNSPEQWQLQIFRLKR